MIRSLLMLGGLVLTAPGVPIVTAAVILYYVFGACVLIYGHIKGKKCESIVGINITYIFYAILILPFIIYFLHPDTDKHIFEMLWRVF